ncbi:hypothetical protein N9A94_00350 [Akkermansiaceae bacterium]|nr:hypothetical protein [Akkermansiaceae bacterium]MDB4544575.1 hypothetical protein [Akkermansiaceae bacterium]
MQPFSSAFFGKNPYPFSVQRWSSLLFLIPILFLQSCIIEGEEEVWIEADGSGKVRVQYTIPSIFEKHLGNPNDYLKAIREIDEKEESVTITSLSYQATGAKSLFGGPSKSFLLEATFKDIMEFAEVAERDFIEQTGANPDQIESIAGKIDFEMNFLSPKVQRRVSLEQLLPPNIKKFPGILGRSNFKYIFHLPFPLEDTNAHFVSEDRKMAQWTFLLKEHTQTPLIMTMETTIPVPWWLSMVIAILALIAIRVLYRVFRGK